MTAGESFFDVDALMSGLKGAAAFRAAIATVENVRGVAKSRVRELELLEREVRDRGDAERGDAFHGMLVRKSHEVERLGQALVVLKRHLHNAEIAEADRH